MRAARPWLRLRLRQILAVTSAGAWLRKRTCWRADQRVVNDHVRSTANALPATSFTRGPLLPPRTMAV
jgi:hypothetical protein